MLQSLSPRTTRPVRSVSLMSWKRSALGSVGRPASARRGQSGCCGLPATRLTGLAQGKRLTHTPTEDRAIEAVTVILKFTQQQLELLDRTVARGAAPDREALIRRALREYAASQAARTMPAPAGSQS